MIRRLSSLLLVVLLTACGSGQFQVSKQEYQSQVQVLGVLPVLVDDSSSLTYPHKDALFDMLKRSAAGQHEILVKRLKEKKAYFDVRELSVNPNLTGMSLLGAGSPKDETGRPLSYRFDPATVAELTRQNVVDALLIVVLTGAQVEETRRSRTMLETLTTTYNDVLATAAVVDRQGRIMWEMAGKDSFQFLLLQYPDFDEAFYNRTERVKVKNISLSGVERALEESADGQQQGRVPRVYDKLFDEVVSGISPGLLDSLR